MKSSLRDRINGTGLTLEQFAEKLGVPSSTVRSWARKNCVNKEQVDILANALNTTRQELEESGIKINRSKRRSAIQSQPDPSSKPLLEVLKNFGEELGARETSELFEHYSNLCRHWNKVPVKLRTLLIEALKQTM